LLQHSAFEFIAQLLSVFETFSIMVISQPKLSSTVNPASSTGASATTTLQQRSVIKHSI